MMGSWYKKYMFCKGQRLVVLYCWFCGFQTCYRIHYNPDCFSHISCRSSDLCLAFSQSTLADWKWPKIVPRNRILSPVARQSTLSSLDLSSCSWRAGPPSPSWRQCSTAPLMSTVTATLPDSAGTVMWRTQSFIQHLLSLTFLPRGSSATLDQSTFMFCFP